MLFPCLAFATLDIRQQHELGLGALWAQPVGDGTGSCDVLACRDSGSGAGRRPRQLGFDLGPAWVPGSNAAEVLVYRGKRCRDDSCVQLDCAPVGGVHVIVGDVRGIGKLDERVEADDAGDSNTGRVDQPPNPLASFRMRKERTAQLTRYQQRIQP